MTMVNTSVDSLPTYPTLLKINTSFLKSIQETTGPFHKKTQTLLDTDKVFPLAYITITSIKSHWTPALESSKLSVVTHELRKCRTKMAYLHCQEIETTFMSQSFCYHCF